MKTFFSAILPTTASRLPFLPLTFECFQRQNADDAELIIVTEDAVAFETAQQLLNQTKIHGSAHLTLTSLSLGFKRNLACGLSSGEWITFWDDDDWSRSDRVDLTRLLCKTNDVVMVGSQTMLVHELTDSRRRTNTYCYKPVPEDLTYPPRFFVGGLLTFKKELWSKHPFADDKMGEETWWQIKLGLENVLTAELAKTDPTLYVSMLHGRNTAYIQSSLPNGDPAFTLWEDIRSLESLMGSDTLKRYEAAAQAMKLHKP